MLSLSYDQWANTSPPPSPPLPQLDLVLTDHRQQHHLNHDLSAYSSLHHHHHHPTIFPDPFSTLCTFPHHNHPPFPSIEALSGYPEDLTRVGLNLGGQTYYFFGDHDPVTRFRVLGEPKCQVDGCNADLSLAKSYHRRHKVCEFHSKAAAVFTAGLTQRFCQQCSRFHVLSEFDNEKRSCRKRLANHNRRRRKSPRSPHSDHRSSSHKSEDAHNSPSIPM